MSTSGVDGAGQALFAFVRHWSRRWNGANDTERADRGREVLAVEAVHALAHRGEVTVNDVAAELGLDQSNASRLLAHAANAGYLVLGWSTTDQRRRTLAVTRAGQRLLQDAHTWQDEVFARLTSDWTPDERSTFARAMHRLVARSAELDGI